MAKEDRVFIKDGRKHFRRKYSLTEVKIGAAVVVALGAIASWVAWKGAHPDPELFKEAPGLPNRGRAVVDRGPVPSTLAPEGWKERELSSFGTADLYVKINGREQPVTAVPGSYVTLGRTWQTNDTIELRMPFHFYLDPVMDQPNVASIFYGPVLLAAEEAGPRTDWRQVTLDGADIGRSIEGDRAALRFRIGDAVLKPFYETYGRHSVYLHVTLK